MTTYMTDLSKRYLEYQKSLFSDHMDFFDKPVNNNGRPPVFIRRESWRNVIVNPHTTKQERESLFSLIPEGERHKWFGSMNSSQALALSILGNLAQTAALNLFSTLKDDDGLPLLPEMQFSSDNFEMEHKIDFLGEPRPTSLDGYIRGNLQIAFECKFTETEVGTCSRPRLVKTDPTYEKNYCNGEYTVQKTRREKCSLSENGILYWRYIPSLFRWRNDIDISPCPLNTTYQLVRNVLAIGVKRDGTASPENGLAILIYDERNPAFFQDGIGMKAYMETKAALLEPTMLRKCSWQCITKLLRDNSLLPWLTDELIRKYGI